MRPPPAPEDTVWRRFSCDPVSVITMPVRSRVGEPPLHEFTDRGCLRTVRSTSIASGWAYCSPLNPVTNRPPLIVPLASIRRHPPERQIISRQPTPAGSTRARDIPQYQRAPGRQLLATASSTRPGPAPPSEVHEPADLTVAGSLRVLPIWMPPARPTPGRRAPLRRPRRLAGREKPAAVHHAHVSGAPPGTVGVTSRGDHGVPSASSI